jgi:hypothetical protein
MEGSDGLERKNSEYCYGVYVCPTKVDSFGSSNLIEQESILSWLYIYIQDRSKSRSQIVKGQSADGQISYGSQHHMRDKPATIQPDFPC